MRQNQIHFESNVLDIVKSAAAKNKKQKAIEELKQKFPQVIASQTQIYQAITGSYDFGIVLKRKR